MTRPTSAQLKLAFGQVLERNRKERDWTLERMARASGIPHKGLIHKLESGTANPCLRTMEKIADGLGLTLGELLRRVCDRADAIAAAAKRS